MDKESIDIRNGGEQALVAAMDKYSNALLRYCHNILCDYHEAQDALQITFIKAYQNHSSFKQDMSLSPWLYRIAYTTCIDILRKRKKVETINNVQPQNEDGRIPDEILSALLKLNSLDRSIVYGRIMEEMSYDELSIIHGNSAAALRKRYERAKKRLANELADDYPYYAQNMTSTLNKEDKYEK